MQETFTIVDLELADYERMAELVETYADVPLGTTDAAVVAVAERLGITEVVRRPIPRGAGRGADHRHMVRSTEPDEVQAVTVVADRDG